MRKMSALVAPNGQETIIPMAVFACEKCGHVNKEFADVAGMQQCLSTLTNVILVGWRKTF